MNTDYPRKLNYSEYEHAFNDNLLKGFVEGHLRDFDKEKMRGLIYGYTFTEDYAKGIIPDTLSMDYWSQINDHKFSCSNNKNIIERCPGPSLLEYLGQEWLICNAIESTGDGTIDNPYSVICVKHEYEFLSHGVFGPIKIIRQRLLTGNIDCIEFEGIGYSQNIYFDISRWFERVKIYT